LAVPLAAWIGGCCKPQPQGGPIQPEDPQTSARRALEKVLAGLGADDAGGKLRAKITTHASSHGGDVPLEGLGESFAQILNRSTFKERGFYTSFGVVNEDSVRHVAEYLNGPTSPLQGWDGWRYRSGIIYEPTSGQKPGPEAQRAAGAAAASSRSIVAVVFDPAGGKR
jgi:hypothetical protein